MYISVMTFFMLLMWLTYQIHILKTKKNDSFKFAFVKLDLSFRLLRLSDDILSSLTEMLHTMFFFY